MEVKIKQGEEMIDATIEMVDGVMVVSPKEVKFMPKDGDVVSTKRGNHLFIFRNGYKEEKSSGYCHIGWNLKSNTMFCKGLWVFERLATEEEKKKLFDKLAEKELSWDAEKKELIKLKWNPSVGQHFYCPEYDNGYCEFIIKAFTYAFEDQIERDKAIAKGWCFKTSKECQEFCDRLNEAISQVK